VATGPLALSYAVEHLGWNMAYTLCGILPIFISGMVFLALPPTAQGIREDEEAEAALQAAEAGGTTA
jgi:dipeptide/tripeptide permease